MAKNFKELEAKMSPAQRKRVAARVKELKQEEAERAAAHEGIKDLCGIKFCENCNGDVDPHGDNCAVTTLADDEEVYVHKTCPPENLL